MKSPLIVLIASCALCAACGGDASVEPTCHDGVHNGDEAGVDCGGSCSACSSCSDGVQNGNETGVDCGGAPCAPCAAAPTCSDGVMNGDETDVDCGGSCAPCAAAPTCSDGVMNGDETDVDCGGSCAPCTTTPTCSDGVMNGDETDVDCGGSCAPCTTTPTCFDDVQNGDETGVDCGGICPPCVDCFPNAMRVFSTSQGYDGDLATAGGENDGLTGADAICQLHASAAALGGTWRAWLSTDSVDAVDRVADVGPWYLVDRCTLVANSMASLIANGPLVDVGVDENGNTCPPLVLWTGTDPTGHDNGFNCLDWASGSLQHVGTAGMGSESFPGAWTESSTPACNMENLLICFEQ